MALTSRSAEAEEMDAPGTDLDTYATCLRDLAVLNRVTFTHRPILRWLDRITAGLPPGQILSILDVACGHGDLLRAISGWATRRGRCVRLDGLDLNPRSAVVATAATPVEMAITYRTGDVFEFDPQPAPDFIVTSQFAHHLTDAEIVRFLGWLDCKALQGWFIADLHRHALAYYGFPLLARAAGWHRIVREDGRISIARSFRRADWKRLLASASVEAAINWHWPFRYGVCARK